MSIEKEKRKRKKKKQGEQNGARACFGVSLSFFFPETACFESLRPPLLRGLRHSNSSHERKERRVVHRFERSKQQKAHHLRSRRGEARCIGNKRDAVTSKEKRERKASVLTAKEEEKKLTTKKKSSHLVVAAEWRRRPVRHDKRRRRRRVRDPGPLWVCREREGDGLELVELLRFFLLLKEEEEGGGREARLSERKKKKKKKKQRGKPKPQFLFELASQRGLNCSSSSVELLSQAVKRFLRASGRGISRDGANNPVEFWE